MEDTLLTGAVGGKSSTVLHVLPDRCTASWKRARVVGASFLATSLNCLVINAVKLSA